MIPTNPELRQFINKYFSDEELETLCFDYFTEASIYFSDGMSKNRKVMKLVEYCNNHGRHHYLLAALFNERQDLYYDTFQQIPEILIDKDKYVDWLNSRPDKVYPGSITISSPPNLDSRIHEKTGIELVRVPAGPFLFGNDKRIIDLPEFWIGRYPVTNAQYKRFVDAAGHEAPAYWNGKLPLSGELDHPVFKISWHDAKAFCDWARLRLPTEEEWEKSGRGTDGRNWPWGEDKPTKHHCNFGRAYGSTTPVGRFSPLGDSPYGCADMVGNVWEWTESWFDMERSGRVERGGSWQTGRNSVNLTIRYADHPDIADLKFVVGFRVVELLSDTDF